jgi:predicted amidohydrolase YtcJ
MRLLTICLLLSLPALASSKTERADLAIYASRVYTVASEQPVEGIVVNKGKIVFAGSRADISARFIIDSTMRIDGFAYPGFIDAHCHFSGYATDAYKCDLVGTTSFEDVLVRISNYEKTNPLSWIYGRGWDQNDWEVKQYPDKAQLDKLFPNKPVILKRVDGHAVLCNQKALDMAGISPETKFAGGLVETKNGILTGILIDNAVAPVEQIIPALPKEVSEKYLRAMEARCFAEGLTGVVDCGVSEDMISLVEHMYRKRALTITNSILLAQDAATISKYAKKGPYRKGQFQVNGIKLYSDGALGSRGACLLEEYHDLPDHKGMLLSDYNELNRFAKISKDNNWQLCTHAIGDSANRTMLDIYGFHLKGKNDLRWRIEHAQVVDKQDYVKFGHYSIVPSVQPTHAISDMPWAATRLGEERIHDAYAYKQLLDQNGWIALGTDFPVEAISPIATFRAAVARKDKNGYPKNGFLPVNALSRMEALKGMTLWAAKSVFLEKSKGSLEPGKEADIVILDKDIMTIPEGDILKAKVLMTLVQGKIVYSNK